MRITLVSPALLAALLASGVATRAQATTAADCSSRSAAILASLREGRFADATRDFDPTMRSGLPASKLQAVWTQALPGQVGALADSGKPPSPADYAKPAHLEPKVIGDIAAWIAHQAPAVAR